MPLPANSPSSGSTAIAEVRPVDPSTLGWHPMFPIELAMKTAPVQDVCAAYGVDKATFMVMLDHPMFQKAYNEAVDKLAKEGMSYKVKAQLISEDGLKTVHELINNVDTPASVRMDALKFAARVAGYEQKSGEFGILAPMQININLG